MFDVTTAGPRARYRQQVRDEIQERAWEQISLAGASALSLKAIATAMGMTAPALYRYYASRDELLTQLIVSTYSDVATRVESASVGRDPGEGLIAVARALRGWAIDNPQRYLLIYGTPVPGYDAPPEATVLAQRIFAPVIAGFTALAGEQSGFPAAVRFWTRGHGVLGLQLAGHFVGMDIDPAQLYDDEVIAPIRALVAAPPPMRA